MPTIPYVAQQFPTSYGPTLAGQNRLTASWAEVAWAGVSVGRAEPFHLVRHGPYSAFEFIYRLAILYANLMEDQQGLICRSPAYDGLDPSEKGAVSFFLGLTFSKLFAHRLLAVPWLMHLDVYRQQLSPVLRGRSRPDLVGQDASGDWIVMESKGRTNGPSQTVLTEAKDQARELVQIRGRSPSLYVALMSHFGPGHLQLNALDPKPESRRRFSLAITVEELWEGYYRPFRQLLSDSRDAVDLEIDGVHFETLYIESADVKIGLEKSLATRNSGRQQKPLLPRQISDETKFVGQDGLLVSTGPLWSAENMIREPQERRIASSGAA